MRFVDPLCAIPWKALPAWMLGDRLRILMYHSIADNSSDPHAVSPQHFAEQMAALGERDYQVISLAEGLRRLGQRLPLRGYIVLTFDDAYRDFLSNAMPVLEALGYPVTLFVPTGLVGDQARWDSYDKEKQLMNWDELGEAHRRGVSIASHTASHARLTECSDEQLEHELGASLEILRKRLGDISPALSYPGGHYGAREIAAARRTGYICAVGVASRWGNGPETDLYRLRRERFTSRSNRFRGLI